MFGTLARKLINQTFLSPTTAASAARAMAFYSFGMAQPRFKDRVDAGARE